MVNTQGEAPREAVRRVAAAKVTVTKPESPKFATDSRKRKEHPPVEEPKEFKVSAARAV